MSFAPDRFIKQALPQEIFCKICKLVMNNPIQCLNCKFFICLGCTQSACGQFPGDRHIYSEIDIKLRNKIKELDIKCKFHKQGCLKIDKVDNIEQHDASCQYAKLICEHSKQNCSSEFHSGNCCPHTLTVCGSCKKQMKLEEKKTHNCIEWLLSQVKLKEGENQSLVYENEKLLQGQKQSKEKHKDFIIDSSMKIKASDQENEEIQTKIQLLYSRLREKKTLLEKTVQSKCFEYNDYCDKKFQNCSDKNQDELKALERNAGKSLEQYLALTSKRLFEFNAAVQADCMDLSTVPIDMKEYDQNPLKSVVFIPSGNPNMKSMINN